MRATLALVGAGIYAFIVAMGTSVIINKNEGPP